MGVVSLIKQGIRISTDHDQIIVNTEDPIKSISVISTLGRVIDVYENIQDNEFLFTPALEKHSQLVIIVVETTTGSLVKKKILY